VQHPQSAFLVRVIEPTAHITLGVQASLNPAFDALRRVINRPTELSIGALESPAEQVFGEITDVAVEENGWLYVLDARSSDVRVFDQRGRLVAKFGRPGRGPGEFANPTSVALGPSGRVYVGDLTRQVHVFERHGPEFKYVRSLRLRVAALDMCIMHGVLVVHGVNLEETRLIHEYDLAGKLLRSFGSVYKSQSPDINFALSKGRLVCAANEGVVLFAPASGIPEVIAYDTTGTPKWLTTFENYQPIWVTEAKGGYGVQVPPSGFHRIQAITYLPPGYVVLQFAKVVPESRGGGAPSVVSLSTVFLRASSGESAYVGDSIPTVAALGPSYYVERQDDPFPQLRLHPFLALAKD
jgi:hypothetical protein